MKTVEEIKGQIAKIENDSRYQAGLEHPATIEINAPLALVQLDLEVKIRTLKWVLGD